MVGDLSVLVNGIGLAVCFTILLVTANTMSMAVRERRSTLDRATRVCTSAGLKGYTWRNIARSVSRVSNALVTAVVITTIALLAGIIVFRTMERSFADVI